MKKSENIYVLLKDVSGAPKYSMAPYEWEPVGYTTSNEKALDWMAKDALQRDYRQVSYIDIEEDR